MANYNSQFFPLQVAAIGLLLVQSRFSHPSMNVVATSFHLTTIIFTTMIMVLGKAYEDVLGLAENKILSLVNPLGITSYITFFLGFILTFASVASFHSEKADLICGDIIFSFTTLVFIGYGIHYICLRQKRRTTTNDGQV